MLDADLPVPRLDSPSTSIGDLRSLLNSAHFQSAAAHEKLTTRAAQVATGAPAYPLLECGAHGVQISATRDLLFFSKGFQRSGTRDHASCPPNGGSDETASEPHPPTDRGQLSLWVAGKSRSEGGKGP